MSDWGRDDERRVIHNPSDRHVMRATIELPMCKTSWVVYPGESYITDVPVRWDVLTLQWLPVDEKVA